MNQNHLAIDLGAESGRVMLGQISSAGVSLSEIHRFVNQPIRVPHEHGHTLHWDILRLWHEIKSGIAKAIDAAPGPINGIAVDVWGIDFALLDARGELVANPVCYRDARTDGMIDYVFSRIPRHRVYEITGIQTMQLNTLFQLASLSARGSPQLHNARHILFLPDLIAYWLCGKMGTEYTIASTSQMLDARTRQWSPEILAAIQIDPGKFPPLDPPGTIRGTLLPDLQEMPGLPDKFAAAKIPVIAVGSHDTASAVAAVPAGRSDDWLYLSSGTWSLLGAEVDQPILTPQAAGFNVTNEGGVGGKIRLLKNIGGLWLLQECRRHWAAQGHDLDYAALTKLAEQSPPHRALLDVDDPSFFTHGDMPEKIAAYCRRTDQPAPVSPGEFTRVILESLAAAYARVARILEQLTGKKFKTLHIVGGGSRNNLLNQMAADATGMNVLAGPVEATALGNVMTQALATGAIPSLADARVLIAQSLAPEPFKPHDTESWRRFIS